MAAFESQGTSHHGSGDAPNLECIACLARQAHEAVIAATPDTELREAALRQAFQSLATMDWHLSPPALAQQIHHRIREVTHNPDPYTVIKQQLNQRAEELYPVWRQKFLQRFDSLEAAVRLAIVGNLLDVGAKTKLTEEGVLAALEEALTAPLAGSIQEFAEIIRKGRQILYLADNAGEIVFDRDLLAHLPLGNVTVAVRGAPILNDATLADAEWAGLGDICDVITNGSDAPGTLLEDCSPEFRRRFAEADLIIAKGQGNYESLVGTDGNIFFLLKVKCSVVSNLLGAPIGSMVINHQWPADGKAGATSSASASSTTRKREGARPRSGP